MAIPKKLTALLVGALAAPALSACSGGSGGGCPVSADDISAAYADQATLLANDDESAVVVREDRWEGGNPPARTCFYLLEEGDGSWISVTISTADSADEGQARFDGVAADGRLTDVDGTPVAASDDSVVVVNVDETYYVVHQERLFGDGTRDSSPLGAMETVVPAIVEAN